MAESPREDELVNHLPDEICIRARATDDADPARLYDQVRTSVNRYLRQPPTSFRDLQPPLAQDIEPQQLTTAADEDVLYPLAGARGTPIPIGSGAWHCYYRVQPAMQRVREVTNLLNLAVLGQSERPTEDGWSLDGGSPNWLTSALPFSCGSPAAVPRAWRASGGEPYDFVFGDPLRAQLGDAHGRQPAKVVVAVLDTCPSVLEDHGNPTLARLLDQLRIVHHGDLPAFVSECVPWWQEQMPPEPLPRPEFAMPDHGLFVAGIVQQIAPDAELHLLQVLNDYGVGDLSALTQVLRSLPETLLHGRPDTRLIVNLSLGSAVPVPRRRFFSRWLPETHSAVHGAWPEGLANDLLDSAHGGLAQTMDWLYSQGVLVVAAAGNDALREHLQGVPPPPRYPAYYESVFAVAAGEPNGEPAIYSNRGDVEPFGNGITTLGGGVVTRRANQPPLTADDGLVGVYSSPTLPGGEPNQTGWVRWSGTSFSAAIVSGLSARLWQQDASQTPADLIHRLRDCAHNIATRRAQGIDPDGPLDAPFLEVHQR
jgi:subtilisin family serine protease